MADLKKLLKDLDAKKAELEKLKPIKADWKRKLDDKYRLEWNFHSNHIEGNTLTYGQTQMLLFFGKATGEHEKREYDEMEAHDVAIKMVMEWAKDKDRDITANDLRELNKIILVKPYWKEAITPDGQPTRKEIIPGQDKSTPNSVRLKSGEIHHYASPEETQARMQELMDTYTAGKTEHPIVRAAIAHHEFTAIHPFDDGNGRVARLWANYILLREGYTPLIIRVNNKEQYLTALQKADTGDLTPFVEYLILETNWSLDKAIDAAQGKSVDEPGDLDKKIKLLETKLKPKSGEVVKSAESVRFVWENGLEEFLMEFILACEKFDALFEYSKKRIIVKEDNTQYVVSDVDDISSKIKKNSKVGISHIIIQYLYNNMLKVGRDDAVVLNIRFLDTSYKLNGVYFPKDFVKRYDNPLLTEEIKDILQTLSNNFYEYLLKYVKSE